MGRRARNGHRSRPADRLRRIPARTTGQTGSSPLAHSSSGALSDRLPTLGVMPGDNAGAIRPDERYEDLVDELVGTAGVTPPHGGGGFGRSALRPAPPPV